MSVIFPSSKDKSVTIVPLHPGHRPWQPGLVATLRGDVEQVIGAVQHIEAARIGRIGVIDRAVVAAPEGAHARLLFAAKLLRTVIVVVRLALLRRERHAEIK